MISQFDRAELSIPTSELERRWAAVRAEMERSHIDVLVMQSNNDQIGGYARFFTDIGTSGGYPFTVIFPRDQDMTLVSHGNFDVDRIVDPVELPHLRGVRRQLTTASFLSATYCGRYDAELAVKGLTGYERARIGLLHTALLPYSFVDYVKKALPNAEFVDGADVVDRVKAIKSTVEETLLKETAELQDAVLRVAFEALEPGRRDIDIAAAAQHFAQEHGSHGGSFFCGSARPDQAPMYQLRQYQNRVIEKGDAFMIIVECNRGGLYSHLGRMAVLGTTPEPMQREFALALQAQQLTCSQLRPGTPAREIWDTHNAFLTEHGRPPERRLYCHGQGHDLVERPLVRFDEQMTIEEHMHIGVHPLWVHEGFSAYLCDNFLVQADGIQRLHSFPQEISEV